MKSSFLPRPPPLLLLDRNPLPLQLPQSTSFNELHLIVSQDLSTKTIRQLHQVYPWLRTTIVKNIPHRLFIPEGATMVLYNQQELLPKTAFTPYLSPKLPWSNFPGTIDLNALSDVAQMSPCYHDLAIAPLLATQYVGGIPLGFLDQNNGICLHSNHPSTQEQKVIIASTIADYLSNEWIAPIGDGNGTQEDFVVLMKSKEIDQARCSPIGTVPKTSSGRIVGRRQIVDMSYPDDGLPPLVSRTSTWSVNACALVKPHLKFCQIPSLARVVAFLRLQHPDTELMAFKLDIHSAYNLLKISTRDAPMACIFFENKYYSYTGLPMGFVHSAYYFQRWSNLVLHCLAKVYFQQTGKQLYGLVYLDDFGFVDTKENIQGVHKIILSLLSK